MINRHFMVLLVYLFFLTLFTPLVFAENKITLGNGYGLPGSNSSGVEVILENDDPVRGVQFTFYDNNGYLTLVEVHTTSRTEGFYTTFGEKSGTVIILSLSGNSIEPGSDSILELIFHVSEEAPEGECQDIYTQKVTIGILSPLDLNSPGVLLGPSGQETEGISVGEFCFINSGLSTTTTAAICASEKIYGEHTEQTEFLRYFRDNILTQTSEGQEIIRLYYQWSPAIVRAMEGDDEFKEEVKDMVDGVLEFFPELKK